MEQTDPEIIAAASKLLVRVLSAQKRKGNVNDIERRLREIIRNIGRHTEEQLLAIRSQEVTAEAQARGFVVQRRSVVSFEGIYGPMQIESPYLWDPKNKAGARPVQQQLAVVARGRSQCVIRALSDFGAEESFAQASKRFQEHYGWSIGRSSILRVVEGVAEKAQEFVAHKLSAARQQYDNPRLEPAASEILVELDGCEIRTGRLQPAPELGKTQVRGHDKRRRQTAWRDVRVGLARRLSEVEPVNVARLDKYEKVVGDLFSAACLRGLSAQTKIIACTDGGNGIREEIEAQFANVQYILDRPHAKGHIYQTADAMGLKEPLREQWVSLQMTRLDSGQIQATLNELSAHRGRGRARAQQLYQYLYRFKDAVHYDDFRSRGLPIGSGEIESAHRTIPQKRLKLPGAWWNEKSLNPMLSLRVLRANNWWDVFWSTQQPAAAA